MTINVKTGKKMVSVERTDISLHPYDARLLGYILRNLDERVLAEIVDRHQEPGPVRDEDLRRMIALTVSLGQML